MIPTEPKPTHLKIENNLEAPKPKVELSPVKIYDQYLEITTLVEEFKEQGNGVENDLATLSINSEISRNLKERKNVYRWIQRYCTHLIHIIPEITPLLKNLEESVCNMIEHEIIKPHMKIESDAKKISYIQLKLGSLNPVETQYLFQSTIGIIDSYRQLYLDIHSQEILLHLKSETIFRYQEYLSLLEDEKELLETSEVKITEVCKKITVDTLEKTYKVLINILNRYFSFTDEKKDIPEEVAILLSFCEDIENFLTLLVQYNDINHPKLRYYKPKNLSYSLAKGASINKSSTDETLFDELAQHLKISYDILPQGEVRTLMNTSIFLPMLHALDLGKRDSGIVQGVVRHTYHTKPFDQRNILDYEEGLLQSISTADTYDQEEFELNYFVPNSVKILSGFSLEDLPQTYKSKLQIFFNILHDHTSNTISIGYIGSLLSSNQLQMTGFPRVYPEFRNKKSGVDGEPAFVFNIGGKGERAVFVNGEKAGTIKLQSLGNYHKG